MGFRLFILSLLLSLNCIAQGGYLPLTVGTGKVTTPAVTYATWNTTYSGGSWSLSGGNLVATISGANQMIIATIGAVTTGKSAGKWYWEITMTSSTGNRDMGVISTLSPSSFVTWVGNQTASTGWGYYSTTGGFTGALFNNGSITNSYFSADYTTGDVIGFALDAGGNTLKLYKNGVLLTPTLALVGGNYFPAVSSNSAVYTANFGASAFAYSVPSGYNAGYYQ